MAENKENTYPILTIKGYGHFNKEQTPGTRPQPPRRTDKRELNFLLQNKNESKSDITTELKPVKVDNFGDPITKNLANFLVQDFYIKYDVFLEDLNKIFDNKALDESEKKVKAIEIFNKAKSFIPLQVTFSKEALMMLLSQPNCAGIKSYYCMGLPEDKAAVSDQETIDEDAERKPSLILVGVDIHNKDLKMDGKHENFINITYTEPPIEPDLDGTDKVNDQETLAYEVGGTDNILTLADIRP